jgi:hypothetical protein
VRFVSKLVHLAEIADMMLTRRGGTRRYAHPHDGTQLTFAASWRGLMQSAFHALLGSW